LSFIEGRDKWMDLNALVRVRATRTVQGKTSVEERFYLTSLTGNAELALRTSRLHWGIENSLHWVLDVVFNDDASRVKDKNSGKVWVTIRQVAAHLLRRPQAGKGSLETKRFKAAMDTAYLEKLIT
uniref:ISAs1 family transposase n=1 Tax=Deinococcus sp. TaxID=47478 RepID=UPI0025C56B63